MKSSISLAMLQTGKEGSIAQVWVRIVQPCATAYINVMSRAVQNSPKLDIEGSRQRYDLSSRKPYSELTILKDGTTPSASLTRPLYGLFPCPKYQSQSQTPLHVDTRLKKQLLARYPPCPCQRDRQISLAAQIHGALLPYVPLPAFSTVLCPSPNLS
jgi:hypothetical protein